MLQAAKLVVKASFSLGAKRTTVVSIANWSDHPCVHSTFTIPDKRLESDYQRAKDMPTTSTSLEGTLR